MVKEFTEFPGLSSARAWSFKFDELEFKQRSHKLDEQIWLPTVLQEHWATFGAICSQKIPQFNIRFCKEKPANRRLVYTHDSSSRIAFKRQETCYHCAAFRRNYESLHTRGEIKNGCFHLQQCISLLVTRNANWRSKKCSSNALRSGRTARPNVSQLNRQHDLMTVTRRLESPFKDSLDIWNGQHSGCWMDAPLENSWAEWRCKMNMRDEKYFTEDYSYKWDKPICFLVSLCCGSRGGAVCMVFGPRNKVKWIKWCEKSTLKWWAEQRIWLEMLNQLEKYF